MVKTVQLIDEVKRVRHMLEDKGFNVQEAFDAIEQELENCDHRWELYITPQVFNTDIGLEAHGAKRCTICLKQQKIRYRLQRIE